MNARVKQFDLRGVKQFDHVKVIDWLAVVANCPFLPSPSYPLQNEKLVVSNQQPTCLDPCSMSTNSAYLPLDNGRNTPDESRNTDVSRDERRVEQVVVSVPDGARPGDTLLANSPTGKRFSFKVRPPRL